MASLLKKGKALKVFPTAKHEYALEILEHFTSTNSITSELLNEFMLVLCCSLCLHGNKRRSKK